MVDRAKKLLENTDLVSLRRAADTDIHPQTTSGTTTNLAVHKHAVQGRMEDGWDHFVVSSSTRQGNSDRNGFGNLLEAPYGEPAAPPHPKVGEGLGRGGKLRTINSTVGCAGLYGGGSTRIRERKALSVAHLSISSKTVHFPRGHVPSVMGERGYGKKRGRINHFAVRTPPPSSSGDDGESTSGGSEGSTASGADLFNTCRAGPSFDPGGRLGTTSGWSLPRDLDPTSALTSPRKTREETANSNNYSIRTAASRVSTCDTINSPSRVAAIMLGVVGVHTALPPPFRDEFDGDSSTSSGFSSRLDAAPASDVDVDGPSYPPPRRLQPETGTPGKRSVNNGDLAWPGDAFSQDLATKSSGGHGGGGKKETGSAFSSSAGAEEYDRMKISRACALPDGAGTGVQGMDKNGGGGCSSHGSSRATTGHTLPLLHRPPGSGVRDKPTPSLVVVAGVDCHPAAVPAPPLSNESTMGRWKSDDDGSTSTISTTTGGGEDRATESIPQAPRGSPRGYRPDELVLGGTTFADVSEAGGGEPPSRPGAGGSKERETPATRESDDLVDLGGIASGRSDPPPTRSKSALRGWSVGRSAPACSPLLTTNRGGAPSKTGE